MFEREQSAQPSEWQMLIETLEQRINAGNTATKNVNVLDHALMIELKTWIAQCIELYFREVYSAKPEANIHITHSWANFSKPGQWHHAHRHQNSFVSGVYYVQCNPDDKIEFSKDHYDQIRLMPKQWNVYNSPTWWLPVKAGLLLLFPSSLIHEVPIVEGNLVRISIAFNTFPSGALGTNEFLNNLELMPPVVKAQNGA